MFSKNRKRKLATKIIAKAQPVGAPMSGPGAPSDVPHNWADPKSNADAGRAARG